VKSSATCQFSPIPVDACERLYFAARSQAASLITQHLEQMSLFCRLESPVQVSRKSPATTLELLITVDNVAVETLKSTATVLLRRFVLLVRGKKLL
jgi:hypothetical protein